MLAAIQKKLMKPLVAQFTFELLFISFVSFFAVPTRLISLIV